MFKTAFQKRLLPLVAAALFFPIWLAYPVSLRNSMVSAAANTWYVALGGSDTGPCNSPAQPCASLQAAIDKAAAGDTIRSDVETFYGQFIIAKDLTLSGGWNSTFTSQVGLTTIDPSSVAPRSGVAVPEGISAKIEYFQVQNAASYGAGGGLGNSGNLVLSHCVITNNHGTYGAGISNWGTMTISDCSIHHNQLLDGSYGVGGGVFNVGNLTILRSTIDHNASDYGGGIYNGDDPKIGTLIIKDSTIWANWAMVRGTTPGSGGGIMNRGTAELINTTIIENSLSYGGDGIGGAGIDSPGPSVSLFNCTVVANKSYGLTAPVNANIHLHNTIVAGNTYADIDNRPFLDGYNLLGSITNSGSGAAGPGNLIGVSPGVAPIQGSPAFVPLTASSPAVNAGDPAGCRDSAGNMLNTDMRGMPRFGRCDIGAYELQPIGLSTFTVDSQAPHTGNLVTYQVYLQDNSTATVTDVQVNNPLPSSFTYIPNSLKASSGSAVYEQGTVKWNGAIAAGQPVTVQYQMNVGLQVGSVTNTATITGSGEVLTRSVTVQVVDKYNLYLPCMLRSCYKYEDDFDDPASGWWVYDDNDASAQYVNGEYNLVVKKPGYWLGASAPKLLVSEPYRVMVDVRSPSYASLTYGLVFGISDDWSQLYTLEIDVNEYWYIWKKSNNTWTLLGNGISGAIHSGSQANRLLIQRDSQTITAYANNTVLGIVKDSSFLGGRMAGVILTSGSDGGWLPGTVLFDNFRIPAAYCDVSKLPPVSSLNEAEGQEGSRDPAGRGPLLFHLLAHQKGIFPLRDR